MPHTIFGTRNVFLYWAGKEYKLISILRDRILSHSRNGVGYMAHLITDQNIRDYVTTIPPYFHQLHPAHQADYVRVHVVCDYGGIWLDSDTLVMDSLDTLFDIIDDQDGFFVQETDPSHPDPALQKILWNGVFGSKKKHSLDVGMESATGHYSGQQKTKHRLV